MDCPRCGNRLTEMPFRVPGTEDDIEFLDECLACQWLEGDDPRTDPHPMAWISLGPGGLKIEFPGDPLCPLPTESSSQSLGPDLPPIPPDAQK